MSGAREQVSRLLALVPYLQTRTDVSLAQVAADFGVRPDQIMKDLQVLWMCGLPGLTPDKLIEVDFEAIEDDPDGVVRIDNADFLARPVRLGSSEASALIVALRALREGSPDASHEVIDRCLVKLEDAAASGTAPPQVEVHLARSNSGQRHAELLQDAIATNRQARLDYYVPTRDETVTEPASTGARASRRVWSGRPSPSASGSATMRSICRTGTALMPTHLILARAAPSARSRSHVTTRAATSASSSEGGMLPTPPSSGSTSAQIFRSSAAGRTSWTTPGEVRRSTSVRGSISR